MRRGRTVVTGLGLVVLTVGAATTASLLTSSDAWSHAGDELGTVAGYLALACALTTASLTLRWVRWNNLVRRCGALVPTRDGAKLYAATLPAIITPFYVGELARAVLLSRRYPGRGWAFAVVWVLERLGDLMAALVLWGALDHRLWIVPVALVAWAAAHIAAAATVGAELARPLRARGALMITMATSLAAWALPGLGLAMVARGFGFGHAFGGLAALFYRSTVLGALTGAPLGVGVTGVLLVHGLQHLGMGGGAAALAVATFRAGTSWFALSLGVLSLAVFYRSIIGPHAVEASSAPHFEEIGSEYADELPAFIRDRLIHRKVGLMISGSAFAPGSRGLELGCGHGWYAAELAGAGYSMSACDMAPAQVAEATRTADRARVALGLSVADGAHLPYADNSFAFAYAINVVHHIPDPDDRKRTLDEVVRVLEPRGTFFLQEINTVNPLFRFYMGYIFPLLHRIDEGTERWIHPKRLPPVAGASWSDAVDYVTFLPEFAPSSVVHRLERLEQLLERSRMRRLSAHYCARLVKDRTRVAEASRV
jgi:SAM-dependent methyltransferase